ncbi:elongation factor 1-beta [Candidatus Pacearchaeota archaeon]|nr:elongation factor 1-beta [Candidatus Pacearchaeota archaeon]
MSIVAIITKVMPDSLHRDLAKIRKEAEKILNKNGAKNISFNEEPVAFGLKAVMIKFAWPEEKSTEIIEDSLGKIEGVSSATVVDYRRAFG